MADKSADRGDGTAPGGGLDVTPLQQTNHDMTNSRHLFVATKATQPDGSLDMGHSVELYGMGGARTPAERAEHAVKGKPLSVPLEPNLFAPVDAAALEEGRAKMTRGADGKLRYDPGILQFSDKNDLEKFQKWLDTKVPPDGTTAADDRRTALIVSLAMADATMVGGSPSDQIATAYQKLNAVRHEMENLLPDKHYATDPGIANAEHFLETGHRVAGHPFDGNAGDLSGSVLRGKWSAPVWEGLSAGYNALKQAGVISGSKAANQHKWELMGIDYGKRVYDANEAQPH